MVKNNTVSDMGIQSHQKVALPAHMCIHIAGIPAGRVGVKLFTVSDLHKGSVPETFT
jgi:hypothetical protein